MPLNKQKLESSFCYDTIKIFTFFILSNYAEVSLNTDVSRVLKKKKNATKTKQKTLSKLWLKHKNLD